MFETPTFDDLNVWAALPAILLALSTCILLIVDLFVPRGKKVYTAVFAAVAVLISLGVALIQAGDVVEIGRDGTAFEGLFAADQFTYVVNIIVLTAAFIGILVSYDYIKRTGIERGEFYSLLLFSTLGAMLMGSSRNLITIFVALELLSIPLYVLTGFRRPEQTSEEGALKYFLLGAFSSGFLVYGVAFIFGATGSFDLPDIWTNAVDIFEGDEPGRFTLLIGLAMTIIALGFKVGAVPFHMWKPDVYQGAPTSVTAFMSVVATAGGFGALVRVLVTGLAVVSNGDAINVWQDTMQVVAFITLALGNVVALMQTDLKRLLAYSSIAHAGYMLIAIAAGGTEGVGDEAAQAILIYLVAYTFTNIGAFAVIIALERDDTSGTALDDMKGLSVNHPNLSLAMTVFMFSLIGMPATAGFVGKWFVFKAAVNAELYVLAVAGVVTSIISVFYYLRVVMNMYMHEGDAKPAMKLQPALNAALLITAIGTLLLGILPYIVTELAQDVTLTLIQ